MGLATFLRGTRSPRQSDHPDRHTQHRQLADARVQEGRAEPLTPLADIDGLDSDEEVKFFGPGSAGFARSASSTGSGNQPASIDDAHRSSDAA
jgi:hypothetical protein